MLINLLLSLFVVINEIFTLRCIVFNEVCNIQFAAIDICQFHSNKGQGGDFQTIQKAREKRIYSVSPT